MSRADDNRAAPKNKKLFAILGGAVWLRRRWHHRGQLHYILAIMLFGDPHPAKLIGPWKGRFVLNSGPINVVYTFNKDGSYRQESYNMAGVKTYQHVGRWGHRGSEIKLSWGDDSFERATIEWRDENTFHYRIVDQDDVQQIGLTTTFKRQ